MTKIAIKAWAGAAALALVLAGCGGTQVRPGSGAGAADSGNDTVITSRVRTALLKDSDIRGTAIQVEVVDGTVQLSGFVRNAHERERAERLARDVAGVREVKNDLRMRQDAD